MSGIARVTGFKKIMHMITGFGAAIVIVGALFKIQHWPGSSPLLVLGLLTEALIFCLAAIDIPHEEVDWTIVYPELSGMGEHAHEEDHEDDMSITNKLDNMLEQAKIGPELIESLGTSMRALSDNASKMADISNAHSATNEYVDSVKSAAKNVNNLSDSYSKAAESLNGLSLSNDVTRSFGEQLSSVSKNLGALNASYELQLQGSNEYLKSSSQFYESLGDMMKNLHDSVDGTRQYKTEINSLSTNLSALNTIYGNMLTAMNFKQGN